MSVFMREDNSFEYNIENLKIFNTPHQPAPHFFRECITCTVINNLTGNQEFGSNRYLFSVNNFFNSCKTPGESTNSAFCRYYEPDSFLDSTLYSKVFLPCKTRQRYTKLNQNKIEGKKHSSRKIIEKHKPKQYQTLNNILYVKKEIVCSILFNRLHSKKCYKKR